MIRKRKHLEVKYETTFDITAIAFEFLPVVEERL